MSNSQCIEEVKKMIEEKGCPARYLNGDTEIVTVSYVKELIERLEKQPEQSRYDIALEVYTEFYKSEYDSFPDWIENKKNNI